MHTSGLGESCDGKDTYLERLPGFLSRFVNLSYTAEEILVDGDRVAAAYTMRAEHDDAPIEIQGVFRLHYRDGLISRRVDYFDSLTFLRQTGQA